MKKIIVPIFMLMMPGCNLNEAPEYTDARLLVLQESEIFLQEKDFEAEYLPIPLPADNKEVGTLSVNSRPSLEFKVIPKLESKSDFYGYLFDISLDDIELSSEFYKTFKQIEKFPDLKRYLGAPYEQYRKAFSLECSSSATDLNNTLASEFGSGIAANFDANHLKVTSKNFLEHCLKKLEEVPNEIRAVTGLFFTSSTAGLTPFCSGTVVGPKEVLTSKHCFVKPDNGARTEYFSPLGNSKIYFFALGANANSEGNLVGTNSKTNLALEKFKPQEDRVYLSLKTAVTDFASIEEGLPAGKRPFATYVVGNSDLVLDDPGSNSKFDRVRASIPNTCAILEITSNGCAYHTCQTGESTSGAGLLKLNADKSVSLIAVHKGGIGRSEGCEKISEYFKINKANLNVAAMP